MLVEATVDAIQDLPKPCVGGSNPPGGALTRENATWSKSIWEPRGAKCTRIHPRTAYPLSIGYQGRRRPRRSAAYDLESPCSWSQSRRGSWSVENRWSPVTPASPTDPRSRAANEPMTKSPRQQHLSCPHRRDVWTGYWLQQYPNHECVQGICNEPAPPSCRTGTGGRTLGLATYRYGACGAWLWSFLPPITSDPRIVDPCWLRATVGPSARGADDGANARSDALPLGKRRADARGYTRRRIMARLILTQRMAGARLDP